MNTFINAFGFGLIILGILIYGLYRLQNIMDDTKERDALAPEYVGLLNTIDPNLIEYYDLPNFNEMSPKSIRAHILALKLLSISNANVREISLRTDKDLTEIKAMLIEMGKQQEARLCAPKFKLGVTLNKIAHKLGEPSRRQVSSNKTIVFYDQNRFEFNEENQLTSYDVRAAK